MNSPPVQYRSPSPCLSDPPWTSGNEDPQSTHYLTSHSQSALSSEACCHKGKKIHPETPLFGMREDARKNSVKAAEKEKLRWKVNKKVREYEIEVWVVQKDISKRANKLNKWEKKAIIKEKVRDYLYRLTWGDEGSLNGDQPGEDSGCCYSAGDLKPTIHFKSKLTKNTLSMVKGIHLYF